MNRSLSLSLCVCVSLSSYQYSESIRIVRFFCFLILIKSLHCVDKSLSLTKMYGLFRCIKTMYIVF